MGRKQHNFGWKSWWDHPGSRDFSVTCWPKKAKKRRREGGGQFEDSEQSFAKLWLNEPPLQPPFSPTSPTTHSDNWTQLPCYSIAQLVQLHNRTNSKLLVRRDFCHNRPYKLMMFQLVGWHFQCTFEIWSQNVGRPNTSMSSQTMGLWILWILFGIVNQCVTLHSRNGRDSNSSHSLCDSS